MTAHCCRQRPGARATIDVFDAMGANIGLYVRVVGLPCRSRAAYIISGAFSRRGATASDADDIVSL